MASPNAIRVQNMRERRRSQGVREATIWIPEAVDIAVEQSVREGRFATKKEAMSKAIETFFLKETTA